LNQIRDTTIFVALSAGVLVRYEVYSLRQPLVEEQIFLGRVKKSECGLPVVPTGDCQLFDPEEEGMHQGTAGELNSHTHCS
jgi:hypothetical protein